MIIAATLCAFFLGVGAAEPVGVWGGRTRHWRAAALTCGTLAAAGLPLALNWVDGPWLLAVLILAAAASAASVVAHSAARKLVPEFALGFDRLLPLALFAPFALLTIAGWLGEAGRGTPGRLSAATTFAGFLLFTVAFGPIRSSFRQIGMLEEAEATSEGGRLPRDQPNRYLDAQGVLRIRALLFLMAALVAALLLLSRVAFSLGAERLTGGQPSSWPTLLMAGLGASILAIWAGAVAKRRALNGPPSRDRRDRLHLPTVAAIAVATAAVLWAAAGVIGLSESRIHYPFAVAAGALLVGALMAESILWNAALVPMIPVGFVRFSVALLVGISGGVASAWLIGAGLWSGTRPVATETAALMTLLVCIPTAVITSGAGAALWYSTRAPHKFFHDLEQTVPQDVVLDLLLFVLAIAVPAAVVGRLDALGNSGRGLAGLAPLVAATGAIAAIYFFLETNWLVPTRERSREPPKELTYLASDESAVASMFKRAASPRLFLRFAECRAAERHLNLATSGLDEIIGWLNVRRICLLRLRVISNNLLPSLMLIFGLLWMAVRLT